MNNDIMTANLNNVRSILLDLEDNDLQELAEQDVDGDLADDYTERYYYYVSLLAGMLARIDHLLANPASYSKAEFEFLSGLTREWVDRVGF